MSSRISKILNFISYCLIGCFSERSLDQYEFSVYNLDTYQLYSDALKFITHKYSKNIYSECFDQILNLNAIFECFLYWVC